MSQSVPDKDSPEWAQWAAEHPLHKAVCGNADAVVQQQRINQLMELIGKGIPRTKRVQFCRDNWGVSDRQIEVILQKTNKAIRQCWEVERPDFMVEQLARLEELYLLAIERNQLAVAAGCINTMARLTGVDQSMRVPSTYRSHHS